MRVGPRVADILQLVTPVQVVGLAVPVEVTLQMTCKGRTLGPDDNRFEPFARPHDEPGAAILKPIGPVLVGETHKMVIGPGWNARAVLDRREVFLVQIRIPREGSVTLEDRVALRIGMPLQQPTEDRPACRILEA